MLENNYLKIFYKALKIFVIYILIPLIIAFVIYTLQKEDQEKTLLKNFSSSLIIDSIHYDTTKLDFQFGLNMPDSLLIENYNVHLRNISNQNIKVLFVVHVSSYDSLQFVRKYFLTEKIRFKGILPLDYFNDNIYPNKVYIDKIRVSLPLYKDRKAFLHYYLIYENDIGGLYDIYLINKFHLEIQNNDVYNPKDFKLFLNTKSRTISTHMLADSEISFLRSNYLQK